MEKRGPGLHHIAVDVVDLEGFVGGLAGSGWYLHPKSLRSVREQKTAWLARPGTAMLIEVQQRQDLAGLPSFITGLEIPLTARERLMVAALDLVQVHPADDGQSWFMIGKHRIMLGKLLG